MCYLRGTHVPEGSAFNPTLVGGEGTCSPRQSGDICQPTILSISPCLGGPGEERGLCSNTESGKQPLDSNFINQGFLRARAPLLARFLSVGGGLFMGGGSTGQN